MSRLFRRSPLMMMHAVTEACNARCPYCVFSHGKRRPDELSMQEIGKLYSDAQALGIQYLHLWGGEPLAHPHIGEIVQIAKKNQLITGLCTNGLLLPRRCEEVIPYVDRLYVSIDHPSPDHDTMRATPGLFDAAIGGIKQVRAKWPGQFVLVAFTLCRTNAPAVEDMVKLCGELGMRLYVNPMRGSANGPAETDAVNNEDLLLSWPEQQPIWERLIQLKRKGLPVQNSFHYMREIARTGASPSYRCHWPKLNLGIDANGGIVDCQRWEEPIANIRETSLAEIVKLARVRELQGPAGERCNTCASPARVEPSRFWGLKPAAVTGSIRSLVLDR